MRRFITIALTLFALLATGCNKSQPEPKLTITNQGSLTVPADGGTVEISYTIDNPMEDGELIPDAGSAGWVHFSDTGAAGTLSLTVDANPDTESRSTTVTLTYSYGDMDTADNITLEQEGAEVLDDFVETIEGVDIDMVYVQGGTFAMGSASESDAPVHNVTLSGYFISKTEITQAQWETVMGTTLKEQKEFHHPDWGETGLSYGEGPDYPMYYVSHSDALAFCETLSSLTGKNYTIPTEAQWEFAARGGVNSEGYTYSGSDNLGEVGWYQYSQNPEGGTSEVATKNPNELGLYDMSGNLWEWCQDWAGSYPEEDTTNPTGPETGDSRIMRGGCWYSLPELCTVTYRFGFWDYWAGDNVGIRIVMIP